MSLRTSANRYARALFDVAVAEHNDLAQVDRDLQALVTMMAASPDLAQAAGLSSVTEAARQSLMEAVADKMALSAPVKKLLVLLAESRKLHLVPDLAVAFRHPDLPTLGVAVFENVRVEDVAGVGELGFVVDFGRFAGSPCSVLFQFVA